MNSGSLNQNQMVFTNYIEIRDLDTLETLDMVREDSSLFSLDAKYFIVTNDGRVIVKLKRDKDLDDQLLLWDAREEDVKLRKVIKDFDVEEHEECFFFRENRFLVPYNTGLSD